IAHNAEPPTFANTIEALEHATTTLDRITGLLFNLNECDTSEALQQVVMDVVPELSRFETEVSMNQQLFERVASLYQRRESLALEPDQQKLLEDSYKGFVRNGVNLPPAERERFAAIEEELAGLTQRYNQNVLADNNAFQLHLTDEASLSGLPESARQAAREEAERRGLAGWVFTLAYPSFGPFMMYADRRDLREQMWRAYNSRGNHGGDTDNNDIIHHIVLLRHEKAALLGFDTYCDYVLSERMVQSLPALRQFMQRLMDAALPVAESDLDEVRQYARQAGADYELQRWDFSYYSEKLKQDKYSFDSELLRPYLPLEQVRQGIFGLYETLYGLTFREADGIEVYNDECKVYEVNDGERFMGVLYMDLHPRATKRSGAWMTEFRGQWRDMDSEVRPLIQIVCNFSRPVGDKPALLSIDEVNTLMHEFGHAMHGMMSDVRYESQSGTNVLRDFVELPSQLMENWVMEPAFLNTFARHYATGAPMPAEYIERLRAAERFLSGYLCVRQLSLGLTDMAFHTLTSDFEGPAERLERTAMVELLPAVDGCNTSTAFTHIFSGGYASGYYGYKWAEVLDADVFSRFKQEGIFNRQTATELRQRLLSRGGTVHPAQLFRDFMGRDPDIKAFLVRSGFTDAKPSETNSIN
ncbi:MAG: M3 family metallopeptidase, partial [Bacteroidales bacterium]|nr:M3 family metallopeptidase [Bacteroidales bacterium]